MTIELLKDSWKSMRAELGFGIFDRKRMEISRMPYFYPRLLAQRLFVIKQLMFHPESIRI